MSSLGILCGCLGVLTSVWCLWVFTGVHGFEGVQGFGLGRSAEFRVRRV